MNTTFLSLMVLSQSDNFEEQKLAEFFYLLKVSQKGSWAFFFEGWRGAVVGAYSNEYSIMKINKPLLILVGFFSNKPPHSFKRSLFFRN